MRTLTRALIAAALLSASVANASETVRADDARIVRMGRTVAEPDGTVRFGYSGVTLTLAVQGGRLAMEAAGGGANSVVDVIVDGGAPTVLQLDPQPRSYELLKDAGPGPHRVDIVHRTETWLGVPAIARFTTDGRITQAPALPSRKLLVLGDSVTCGAGMQRPSGPDAADKGKPSWWNAGASYGMLLGQALHAQVQLVCFGGRGLVRSYNNRTDEYQLPAFYELAIPDAAHPVKWNQADYDPDLILVTIGTNDFTQGIPERAWYVDTYVNFVRTLLRDHPHAKIALSEGAILDGEKKAALTDYIAATVARVGDPRVRAIPSIHHPGDSADAHPTTPQHAEMARELAPPLQALMGW
ncbi:GDSL-type esterase/lipase family protein [Massilia sp. 9096]|uniref:GDSL-type esterase/lipase family protein n=1 Tax=Massilia sp. 9096 TaxID=1500894 RepID=UPI000566D498|nr:GDSL-type esterase/lipase family protein [Massilia sp. 9096]